MAAVFNHNLYANYLRIISSLFYFAPQTFFHSLLEPFLVPLSLFLSLARSKRHLINILFTSFFNTNILVSSQSTQATPAPPPATVMSNVATCAIKENNMQMQL